MVVEGNCDGGAVVDGEWVGRVGEGKLLSREKLDYTKLVSK